jgi:aspartyl-tRNA(Asn)/glutamyl-tRNA(Gln) amidotransferase subunit A
VLGNLARSVRDAARYYDVCAGPDPFDPSSIPSGGNWEAALGSHDLRGKRVAIVPSLGGVTLEPGVETQLRAHADDLVAATGMVKVDLDIELPNLAVYWMVGNLATLLADLGDRWPRCASELTDELVVGLWLSGACYNLPSAAIAEAQRVQAYEAMARAFEQVDFVIAATNPGPAFAADAAMSTDDAGFIGWAKNSKAALQTLRGALTGVRIAGGFFPKVPTKLLDFVTNAFPDLVNMGALTIISNMYGNPAVSIPGGAVDGLPVGMQVLGRHHTDALLFDVALAAERAMPWPLVAPYSGSSVASSSRA